MNSRKFPLQIGVTGGIGSGKSVVCKVFSCLGVPVYDADSRAKWLTVHDSDIKNRVMQLLGEQSYTETGDYNRAFVASRVFNNPELLSNLNSIIHPAVLQDTVQWVKRHSDVAYVIKEAAIMKAAGQGNDLDYVVVVEAPVSLRVDRILARDKRSREEINAIISRQISEEERKIIADFVIRNDEVSALIPQVLRLHEIFMQPKGAN
jgi:dephospho-CoA kinase